VYFVNKWITAKNDEHKTQQENWRFNYSKNKTNKPCNQNKWLKMGRINVDISAEVEKQLRLKTVEKFGGKKGDLSRAVQEAIKTWINQKE